jgi:dienelactone hydrolase
MMCAAGRALSIEKETHMSAVDYAVDGKAYEGWFVPAKSRANAPVVMIAHAWGGLGDNEKSKAQKISAFGYHAFASDVYGKGKRGVTQPECEALMYPLVGDRAELQKRLAGSLAAAMQQFGVLGGAAAIGFCFGGLCVLDMARAGMDVKGVASFHGLFRPAENIPNPKINAKVLIEHGWQDPMATPQDVLAIAKEMDAAGADWRLDAHGKAVHAFTTEGANHRAGGTEYDRDADRRSFAALEDFLKELFG